MSAHWRFLPRAESWGRAEGDKIVLLGFGGSASGAELGQSSREQEVPIPGLLQIC